MSTKTLISDPCEREPGLVVRSFYKEGMGFGMIETKKHELGSVATTTLYDLPHVPTFADFTVNKKDMSKIMKDQSAESEAQKLVLQLADKALAATQNSSMIVYN